MTPAFSFVKARKRKGWTQKQLAKYFGVSIRTVKYWEANGCSSKAVGALLKTLK